MLKQEVVHVTGVKSNQWRAHHGLTSTANNLVCLQLLSVAFRKKLTLHPK